MNLLIVESPGKIKKLKKILGNGWMILASMGHFRTLAKDGNDNLGFDFQGERVLCRFTPKDSKSQKIIKDLRTAAKKASQVFIATDPDREGEVIGWHLKEILDHPHIVRVSYAEITAAAVNKAIANPRELDLNLVGSGLARSCLDKLVGFKGSPLVWSLGAKSVGRVQSAVLHLVCNREREILNFKPVDYFSVFVDYAEEFRAYYDSGGFPAPQNLNLAQEEKPELEGSRIYQRHDAEKLVEIAKTFSHKVTRIERNTISKKPPPPFITSSLQQAAGSKLGLSPDKTMKLAQTLYERGLITYMRTDSVALSEEFCAAARQWLLEKDPDNVPQKQTKFKSGKGSQEAHEAIRPSNLSYPSAQLKQEVSAEEFNLYLLIWKRAIASQCCPARIDKTTLFSQSGEVTWKAKGQVVQFHGYAKYWPHLSAPCQLPLLNEEQPLTLTNADLEQKQTSPPSRFGEPQLIALMEKKGIGRPSTYSSAVKTIKSRSYVKLTKKKLFPTELGMAVDSFLEQVLKELISAEFTAQMELSLDQIAKGELKWQPYLTNWNRTYFSPALAQARAILPESISSKPKGTVTTTKYLCPVCKKPLERYDYSKSNYAKRLLRCSDIEARNKSNHKEVVFFPTRQGSWWSQKFGELHEPNIKDCDRSPRKTPPIRLKKK